MAVIDASATSTIPPSPDTALARDLLSESNALMATSTFFHCGYCKKFNLYDTNHCGITAIQQNQSYSFSWKNKSAKWPIEKGIFRVIFYLNGKVELIKESSYLLEGPWPERLIQMVGEKRFSQLKKIISPCEKEFYLQPTLDMIKDGPVILTTCNGSAFAFGVTRRQDRNRPAVIFYIFSQNQQWFGAWNSAEKLPHSALKDPEWETIERILGGNHSELELVKKPSQTLHQSATLPTAADITIEPLPMPTNIATLPLSSVPPNFASIQWPEKLVKIVGQQKLDLLKKIELPNPQQQFSINDFLPFPSNPFYNENFESFHNRLSLEMIKDGPVIVTGQRLTALAFGLTHRTKLDNPTVIYYISQDNFPGYNWVGSWHPIAQNIVLALINDQLPHNQFLEDPEWEAIAKIFENNHPEVELVENPSQLRQLNRRK